MILTLTDQLRIIARETVDSTTDTREDAIVKLNIYQDEILSSQEYKFTEAFYSFTSVADQQNYDWPIRHKKIKTIVPSIDSRDYPPLVEIADPNEWDLINANSNVVTSSHPTHFHIRNKQIYVYPTPGSTDITFKVWYSKRAIPMVYEDYNTGSIAVTNGSKSVIGTGTSWSSNVGAGSKIKILNDWYDVASVTSNTALVLVQAYQGTSASGITSYKTGDTSLIHEDFQSILWNRYCYEYYRRNNPDRAKDYFAEMARLKADMDSYVSSQTTSRVIELDSRPIYRRYPDLNNTIFD